MEQHEGKGNQLELNFVCHWKSALKTNRNCVHSRRLKNPIFALQLKLSKLMLSSFVFMADVVVDAVSAISLNVDLRRCSIFPFDCLNFELDFNAQLHFFCSLLVFHSKMLAIRKTNTNVQSQLCLCSELKMMWRFFKW